MQDLRLLRNIAEVATPALLNVLDLAYIFSRPCDMSFYCCHTYNIPVIDPGSSYSNSELSHFQSKALPLDSKTVPECYLHKVNYVIIHKLEIRQPAQLS